MKKNKLAAIASAVGIVAGMTALAVGTQNMLCP
jgi:hypothetical protein